MGGLSPLLGLEPVLFRERVHRLTVYTLFEDTSWGMGASTAGKPPASTAGEPPASAPPAEADEPANAEAVEELAGTGAHTIGPSDIILSRVEFVISAPTALTQVLKFQKWLMDVVGVDLNEISGSPEGETVLKVRMRQRLPLLGMLGDLQEVINVIEEPSAEAILPDGSRSLAEVPDFGMSETLPRRFRLVLRGEGRS